MADDVHTQQTIPGYDSHTLPSDLVDTPLVDMLLVDTPLCGQTSAVRQMARRCFDDRITRTDYDPLAHELLRQLKVDKTKPC